MTGPLERGRDAHRRGEWAAAYAALAEAAAAAPLDTDDLARFAEAAWLTGRAKESLTATEAVYTRRCRRGEHERAATAALEAALLWSDRGDFTLASGWMNRARRALGGLDVPAAGYLAYLDAALALEVGDTERALKVAPRLAEDAVRLDTPVLASLGLVLGGLADIRRGRTASGFAQLDEAMLPILAGQVPRLWAADVYCVVIHTCHQLADNVRMRAWTDAMQRWCETLTWVDTYSGICRVHRLELQAHDGEIVEGEQRLASACADLVDTNVWVAGAGLYALGELRRRRGDLAGAHEAYEQARELGTEPLPGQALAWCTAGRIEPAWSALRAEAESRDALGRARLLPALVEVGLQRGSLAEAQHYWDELEAAAEQFDSEGFRAWARHWHGALLCAQGRAADAATELVAAIRLYRGQHERYGTARAYECLAHAHRTLGDTDLADADLATALTIYRRVGADPDVRRLDVGKVGGLTAREVEILRLIAAGATNREVAASAFISEKTVSRHLANIFTKIGVSSRTAAAAWAREHGVV
ncbi:MAG TPA: LuxR C-terminal-related transcriptional regulator [Aldersonia sp.]